MNIILANLNAYRRFALGLRKFLRQKLKLAEAKAIVRQLPASSPALAEIAAANT